MKELNEFMIRVGKEGLDELGRKVAKEIFSFVDHSTEDSIKVTMELAKSVVLNSMDLQLAKEHLDASEQIAYEGNLNDLKENFSSNEKKYTPNYMCSTKECGYSTGLLHQATAEELDIIVGMDGGYMKNKTSLCPSCKQDSLVYIY